MSQVQASDPVNRLVCRDGLQFVHQPIVNLRSGARACYELLLRVVEDGCRLLPPGDLIHRAEQDGLMPLIDHWAVQTAAALLTSHPHLTYFVNLSPATISNSSAMAALEHLIQDLPFRAGHLVLEITEHTVITDFPSTVEWMRRLKCCGCRFAMDDFGVGFSSFKYLQLIPVDYIKIDGSFVTQVVRDHASREIVKAIAGVAHAMSKPVIGESVESREVAKVIKEIGIEYGQGYYLGRPQRLPNTK